MAILKTLNSSAAAGSILQLTDGADLCCGNQARVHYATAEFPDGTAVTSVNVTQPGSAAQTITLDNQPHDLSDSANWPAFIEAMGKAATDLGWNWFDGGISVEAGPTANNVIVKVLDSTLIFNWVGVPSSFEQVFVATNAVP